MDKKKKIQNIVAYSATLLLALLFLFVGNRVASQGMAPGLDRSDPPAVEAKVTQILDITIMDYPGLENFTTVTFEARVTKGDNKNETVVAVQQTYDGYLSGFDKEVEVGNKIVLSSYDGAWHFSNYIRIDKIMVLGGIIVVLLIVFGRIKGINTILTLGFTCAAIFAVFIPSILSGKNIYISSVIVCIYAITVTLSILNGISKKSLAAIAGCICGVAAAGIVALLMNRALFITGIIDQDSVFLYHLRPESPIDLKAVIFAGIIIGAVGAIMDVAVSISSALWELKMQAPDLAFQGLFKSGINIGRDIMGSMTNTLVLAYIGSSLAAILILISYVPLEALLNRQTVIVELLQALIGSLGILLTMPLTALISAALLSNIPSNKTHESLL